nr:protease modulator HflC [Pseudomonadota bacterium]
MNKQHILPVTATALLLLFWLLSSVLFIVYPWQSVMIIQFGEPLSIKKDPGLYVKTPWQDLVFFDSRVLTIDPEEPDRYITAEKENLLVDAYI